MNAWKIIYIMAQWLVFITAYNRLLEALPVFIEMNAGVRPWCLCRKLWNKENNLMACPALEFHPSRGRAAPGSSPCSLVAIQADTVCPWLLLALVVQLWSTTEAQVCGAASSTAHMETEISPKSEGVELYLIASHDVVRYKQSPGSYSWKSISGSPRQFPSFTKDGSSCWIFASGLLCWLLNSPVKKFLQISLLPPKYFIF